VDSGPRGRRSGLVGRRAECRVLDQLLEAVCTGQSRVLVVHGEPGAGKTALLEYLAGQAYGFQSRQFTKVRR
jgi:predicted ATPase